MFASEEVSHKVVFCATSAVSRRTTYARLVLGLVPLQAPICPRASSSGPRQIRGADAQGSVDFGVVHVLEVLNGFL